MTAHFTIKHEADFIALAPVMLGFQPEHSLVMLTFDSFTARIDLPDEDLASEFAEMLLEPAQRHKVRQVAFVIYDEDDQKALLNKVIDVFLAAGIKVIAGLEYNGSQYRNFGTLSWEDFDIQWHPITLEAVYQNVTPRHTSRDQLKEYAQPGSEAWDKNAEEAVNDIKGIGVEATVQGLTRLGSQDNVVLWLRALRGCKPGTQTARDVATVLGFAAWLHGDGALAWVAHDQAGESDMQSLLAHLLQNAVSPDTWPNG